MSQDNAVNDEVVTDATVTESAPVVNNESDADITDDAFSDIDEALSEELANTPLDESVRQETDSSDTDETEADQQEEVKAPNPKDEWDSLNGNSQERFRQAINERNELRRQMQEREAKKAQFATEQDLVDEINPETGEYYTPQEIERISWLAQREAQAERNNQELYGLQVRERQQVIDSEAAQVKDIPMFNPESKQFRQERFNSYVDVLNDNLIYRMPDGNQYSRSTLIANGINPEQQATLVDSITSPLKLAKLIADSYTEAEKQGEVLGQANAQRATNKMLANADSPSGAPSRSSGDSLDSLFNRVKDIPLS